MAEKTTIYGQPLTNAPKPPKPRAPKAPTATQKKEAEALAKRQLDAEFRAGLTQMTQQPEYAQADLQRRQEMAKEWEQNVWKPKYEELKVNDPAMADTLNLSQMEIIQGNLKDHEKAVRADGSYWGDAGRTIKTHADGIVTGIANAIPLARQNNELVEIDQEMDAIVKGIQDGSLSPQDPEVRFKYESLYQRRGGVVQKAMHNTNEVIKHQAYAEDLNEKMSGMTKDKQKVQQRLIESGDQAFAGTKANFSNGFWDGVGGTLVDLSGMSLDLTASVGTAALGQLVGIPAPITAGAMMGVIAGGSSGNDAYSSISQMSHEDLAKTSEDYRNYIAMGYTPDFARSRVASSGTVQAALTSGGINALSVGVPGALGKATSVVSKGGARVGRKPMSHIVGGMATTTITESGINSLDALAVNYAVAHNSGDYSKMWVGVGDAAFQGGALGGATHGVASLSELSGGRGDAAEAPAPSDGSVEGSRIDQVFETTEAYVENTTRAANTLANAMTRTMDKEVLTASDIKGAHASIAAAIDAGVDPNLIRVEESKFLGDRADYTPFDFDGYESYKFEMNEATRKQEEQLAEAQVEQEIAVTEADIEDNTILNSEGEVVITEPVADAIPNNTPEARTMLNRDTNPEVYESSLTGADMTTPEGVNAEINARALQDALVQAEQSLEAVREATSQLPENALPDDATIDALVEGLAPLYLADPAAFESLRGEINSIAPNHAGFLAKSVEARLRAAVGQAESTAQAKLVEMSSEVVDQHEKIMTEIQEPRPSEESIAELDAMLTAAETPEAREAVLGFHRERLSAGEASRREREARRETELVAQAEAHAKKTEDLVKKTDKDIGKFSGLREDRRTGYLSDAGVVGITKQMLELYQHSPDAVAQLSGKIDAMERSTEGTENSLSSRINRLLKDSYVGIEPNSGAEGRARAGARLDFILGENSRRNQSQTSSPVSSDLGGNREAVGRRRFSGTEVSDAPTPASDAVLPQEAGAGGESTRSVRGSDSTGYAYGRRPTSDGQRSSWSEVLERSNYGRGDSTSGQPQQVNPFAVTNFIEGTFDADLTENGFSTTKIQQAMRRGLEGDPPLERTADPIGDLTPEEVAYYKNRAKMEELDDLATRRLNGEFTDLNDIVYTNMRMEELLDDLRLSGFPGLENNVPSGKTALEILSAVRELSEGERQLLNDAYMADDGSMSSGGFMSEMMAEAIIANSGGEASPRFNNLASSVKAVLNKLAKFLAGAAIIMSSFMGTVEAGSVDTIGRMGGATVEMTAPAGQAQISSAMSEKANVVGKFVMDSGDNNGGAYVIADKATGEVHIMDANHQLVHTSSALFGKNVGDGKGWGNTPAGAFTLKTVNTGGQYGGDIAQFSTNAQGDIFAIHRVANVKGQDRGGRLQSSLAEDKRISNGCINLPEETYNKYFGKGGAQRVYIVPETQSVESVFFNEAYKAEQRPKTVEEVPARANAESPMVSMESTRQAVEALPPEAQAEFAPMLRGDVGESSPADPTWLASLAASLAGVGVGAVAIRSRRKRSSGGRVEPTMQAEAPGLSAVRSEPSMVGEPVTTATRQEPTATAQAPAPGGRRRTADLAEALMTQEIGRDATDARMSEVVPGVNASRVIPQVGEATAPAETLTANEIIAQQQAPAEVGPAKGGRRRQEEPVVSQPAVDAPFQETNVELPPADAVPVEQVRQPARGGAVVRPAETPATTGAAPSVPTKTSSKGVMPSGPTTTPTMAVGKEPTVPFRPFQGSKADYDPKNVGSYKIRITDRMALLGSKLFVADLKAGLTEFVLKNLKVTQAQVYQMPLIEAKSTESNRRNAQVTQMNKKYMAPVLEFADEIAKRLNKDLGSVAEALFSWATWAHIPEANAALLRRMEMEAQGKLEEYSGNTNLTVSKKLRAEYLALQREVELFKIAQKNGQRVEGQKMAGGLTDLEAQQLMENVLAEGITEAELAKARAMITGSFKDILTTMVDAGVLDPGIAEQWQSRGFKGYVPLYVEQETASDRSFFHNREGSNRRADHSMFTLQEYIQRAASAIAGEPFARELNKTYEQLSKAGKHGEIIRVELKPGEMPPPQSMNGVTYTRIFPSKDGGPGGVKRYRLWFGDEGLNSQMRRDELPQGWMLNTAEMVTRFQAKMVTAYVPVFAPLNAARDVVERTVIALTRNVNDAAGNPVSPHLVALRMNKLWRAPGMINDVAKAMVNREFDTKYGEVYKRLYDLGGLSLYSAQVFAKRADVDTFLKSGGVRKAGRKIDSGVQLYNDILSAVPSVLGFMALTESGVPESRAAALTLQAMNFTEKGSVTRKMEKFFPFVNSAFTGGANVFNSFGIGVGLDFFSKENAIRLATMGALTITAVMAAGQMRELMGTDENDEYIMDKMTMQTLRGGIPVSIGDTTLFKVPIGFGTPQILWTWGLMLDRMVRGRAEPEDFIFETASTYAANGMIDPTPGYNFKDAPLDFMIYSATPQVFKSLAEVATNRNYFGNALHQPSKPGQLDKDQGRVTTAPVYTQMADFIHKTTGMDVFPESVKSIWGGVAMGPLEGLTKVMESQGAYYSKTAKTERFGNGHADALFQSLGMNRLLTSNKSLDEAYYYRKVNAITEQLKAKGISIDGTLVGLRGEKRQDKMRAEMRAKGFSTEQVADVLSYMYVKNKREGVNRKLRTEISALRGVEAYDDALQKRFDSSSREIGVFMQQFHNSVDIQRWRK